MTVVANPAAAAHRAAAAASAPVATAHRRGIRPTVMCTQVGASEQAEKLRPVKLRDGSVTFNRVGDPNRSVSNGPDSICARSNSQRAIGRRGPIR